MFCTNGVLLRMLTGAGRTPLAHVTHLVRACCLRHCGQGRREVCVGWVHVLPCAALQVPRLVRHHTICGMRQPSSPLLTLWRQVANEIHERSLD